MHSRDSSPLYTSESLSNHTKFIQYEQSSTSSDDTMPIIVDVQSIDLSNTKKRSRSTRTSLVTYGPISVRKRHTIAPTLATGRRAKDAIIEGEEAVKREIRRMKNRESARNLKKLRDDIEHGLENEVDQLKFEEQNLLIQVNNLQVYKQHLEEQCRHINPIYKIVARTASAVLLELNRQQQQTSQNVSISIEPKEEPRSPSPQWQLMFRI